MRPTREWGPVTELALDAAGMISIGLLVEWSVEAALSSLDPMPGSMTSLALMAASIVAFVILLRDVVRQIWRLTGRIRG